MSDEQAAQEADIDGAAEPVAAKKAKGGRKKELRRLTRQRRRLLSAVLVEAAVIAGLVVWLVLALMSSSHERDRATAAKRHAATADELRNSAMASAREYAIDFSTYDYRHLDQDFQTVTSHLAPSFRAQYQQTVASLKSLVVQYRGTATATVQGVGLASLDQARGTAVVLVFLDQKVTNSNLKAPRIDTNRLQITLQRTGSAWLMSDLQLK
jgi:Mce-associated membrane protein